MGRNDEIWTFRIFQIGKIFDSSPLHVFCTGGSRLPWPSRLYTDNSIMNSFLCEVELLHFKFGGESVHALENFGGRWKSNTYTARCAFNINDTRHQIIFYQIAFYRMHFSKRVKICKKTLHNHLLTCSSGYIIQIHVGEALESLHGRSISQHYLCGNWGTKEQLSE